MSQQVEEMGYLLSHRLADGRVMFVHERPFNTIIGIGNDWCVDEQY